MTLRLSRQPPLLALLASGTGGGAPPSSFFRWDPFFLLFFLTLGTSLEAVLGPPSFSARVSSFPGPLPCALTSFLRLRDPFFFFRDDLHLALALRLSLRLGGKPAAVLSINFWICS
uniref:Putative secreted protein n=1 Tax=Ixodes ricinus TaxID=34613 RepID=A0A6B0UL22_IXORI